MAAGIVGGELGMDVFRVDLSRMVSKYIGETEKNLSKVFDEAGKSQSILLFDEADSLFAKRTGVNSAVDRYANLEVNYLLQRVEDFDGVTILTTNFEGSIDEAFRRRIKFRVVFPAPDQEMRSNLWAKMIPAEAQREGVLDFEALAHDYELSGGHIKNSTLRAAFSAAERRGGISMKDRRRAARLESEKLGKIVRVPDDIDTSGN
jgi:SpoVK/Ycf46/Vps4 family AAA+-type ATPase